MLKNIEYVKLKNNIIAGFTNRLNGQSIAPYKSFNLGKYTDDSNVDKNYSIINKIAPFSKMKLHWLNQVHGNNIIEANDKHIPQTGDGLFTTQKGILLAVQTADCLPIIISHKHEPFIAVIHAGWQGLKKNIILELSKIINQLKLEAKDLKVAVGPHLKKCHFKVKNDFLDYFPKEYFVFTDNISNFDATKYALKQLMEIGIQEESVIINTECTHCNQAYFSYRREGITGRQIGFVGILPE